MFDWAVLGQVGWGLANWTDRGNVGGGLYLIGLLGVRVCLTGIRHLSYDLDIMVDFRSNQIEYEVETFKSEHFVHQITA